MRNRWIEYWGEDPVDRSTTSSLPDGRETTSRNVPPPMPYTGSDTTDTTPKFKSTLYSQKSGLAPFETFFNDFQLEAIPFYNFWEKDEEQTLHERGNQELVDVPRFVKLAWNPAPDLKDPKEFEKRALAGGSPDSKSQFTQLSPFGFGAWSVVGASAGGTVFLPDHLQPSAFKQNAQKLANGYLFSGIAEAVVSVPTSSVTEPVLPTPYIIDEDEYLSNHSHWWGIPYSEYNAALWRRRSSIYGAQQQLPLARYSSQAESDMTFVEGQFGLSAPGSRHEITAINPSSPNVSIQATAAVAERGTVQPRIEEMGEAVGALTQEQSTAEQSVRAKFIHTNFMGAVTPERVNSANQPHQVESVAALAPLAGNLVALAAAGMQHYKRDLSIPSFSAPDVLKPLEYIGYIIEKWEQVDGVFKLSDTFYIPGREYTDYIDAGVKYGVMYRYRIRGVVRWSRPHGVGPLGKDPTIVDPPGASIRSLAPNDVSYFGTEWGSNWSYTQLIDRAPPPPPEEFTVRPISNYRDGDSVIPVVEVAFRLPYNPQLDINKMVLYRKLQDADGIDLTGWVQVQEFSESQRQGTRSLITAKMEHEQDDITGTKYNVSETTRSEVFVEYGPDNGYYIDRSVNYFGDGHAYRYVYAAVCYTRHGERSAMSDQLAARCNPDWKRTGEIPVDFVSCAGVDIDFDTGLFSTYPERRLRSEVVTKPHAKAPARVSFKGQERRAKRALESSKYNVRVESLDTGERFDLPVAINVVNGTEQTRELPYQPLATAG